jgi:AcrR family transcriptional regulator
MGTKFEIREIDMTSGKNRKEKTRAKILKHAYAIFVDQGYERATLTEISDRAGVHLQTMVRHFPTKADIIAAIHISTYQMFEEFFNQRTGTSLERWREWIQRASENSPEVLVFPTDSYRFPVITSEGQDAIHRVKDLLAEGIAEDMGVNRSIDLRPTLVACMLTAGNAHVAQSWAGKRFVRDQFVASLLEVVDLTGDMLSAQFPSEDSKRKAS